MTNVHINVINKSPHPLPKHETDGSIGFDIRAWIRQEDFEDKNFIHDNVGTLGVIFNKDEIIKVSTGLYMEIPQGYAIVLCSRSGLSAKGIIVNNAPGLVDSDYRGHIQIILKNNRDDSEPHTLYMMVTELLKVLLFLNMWLILLK